MCFGSKLSGMPTMNKKTTKNIPATRFKQIAIRVYGSDRLAFDLANITAWDTELLNNEKNKLELQH